MLKSRGAIALKLLLWFGGAGAFIGLGSRLMLVGSAPNSQILPSLLGLIVFCVIGYGVSGILYGLQNKLWAMILPHTTILVAGIMWVVPFPN